MNNFDFSSLSDTSFLKRLESSEPYRLDPFQLRRWIDLNFPDLAAKDKLWLSQSLTLGSRLSEKHFPYSFWWITQTLFEMATDFRIARFHAQLISEITSTVTDLTAGSGFDLLAFLEKGLKVNSYETDDDTATLLERNLNLYSQTGWLVSRENWFASSKSVPEFWFADPMRRSGKGRTFQLESYSPPFSEIVSLKDKSSGGLVKISPMANLADKQLDSFKKVIVSLDGECREVLLIHGESSVTDGSLWIDGRVFNPERNLLIEDKVKGKGHTCIFDPDPAVMKSGELSFWSEKCGLQLPAPDSGFPVGENETVERLFKQFLLIDHLAYKLTDIPALARKYSPRKIVLKKKNSSVKLELVEKELGNQTGKTEPSVYFFITSEHSKTVVYVAELFAKIH